MIMAITCSNPLVLKELIRAGADLNLQNEVTSAVLIHLYVPVILTHLHFQDGLSALMISSRSGSTHLTEMLLSDGGISLDSQTVRKCPPAMFVIP